MRLISFSNRYLFVLGMIVAGIFILWDRKISTDKLFLSTSDSLLVTRSGLKSNWKGEMKASSSLAFLILAGHADSQGLAGAGTRGEAVDLNGALPMDPSMSDELYWNLIMRDAIVRVGKEMGLNIDSYDPDLRNIVDGNHPSTNWSVGAKHVRRGGYALEIHFDSYGEYGIGSGLIPAVSSRLNTVDESLARSFGRYPIFFRGGLGAPRRGIRVLELGKLEGILERDLRDPSSRQKLVDYLAIKVVQSLMLGIEDKQTLNQQHHGEYISPKVIDH